jgi:hypothetical protein
MKRIRLASILFFAMQTLLHPGALSAQTLAELNQDKFPLAVGNRWEYRATTSWNLDNPETFPGYTSETEVVWEITARETVLGQEAYRFEITHRFLAGPDSGAVRTGQTWFAMSGDTLRSVAAINTGGFEPGTAQLFKPVVQEEEPFPWNIISLIFPLSVGQSWDFGAGFFENDTKVVETEERVLVPAGEFETFKVVRLVEFENSTDHIRTEQWFASVGLVKMKDEQILTTTVEPGDDPSEGNHRVLAEMELHSFHLAGESTAIERKSWGQIKDLD